MRVGNCPSCGAPVEFEPGAGKVKVCEHCQTVVLRGEAKLEDLGKVAELADTDSPLKLGLDGKVGGVGFRVVGRIQKSHGAGVWDEWCLHFDDDKTGWLSESEGQWNLMSPLEQAELPPFQKLAPLSTFALRDKRFVVEEVGHATTVSAEGQLPDFAPDHPYADATGPGGAFVSLDYGGAAPEAYLGRTLALDELGFDKAALEPSVKRQALRDARCPNCNGPMPLQAPDAAKRVACQYCGALHEVKGGKLEFLELLQKPKTPPLLRLGKKGKLEGVEWTVLAFLVRGCEVEGNEYFWDEYLLWNRAAGFRWLMCANGHWTFLTPVAAGDVAVTPFGVTHRGAGYKFFQSVNTVTHYVLGECYWEVTQGETGWAAEFVRPPLSINQDMTANEVTFTLGKLLEPEVVKKAFVVEVPKVQGIAPAQENPYGEKARDAWKWAGIYAVALFGLFLVFSVMSFSGTLWSGKVGPPPAAAPGSPEAQIFTPEFEVPRKTGLAVSVAAPVDNDWMAVQADLVNVDTGEVISVYGEAEYYHGYTDGESWSEGSRSFSKSTSDVDPGLYLVRFTPSWDRNRHRVQGPEMSVEVKGDGPGWGCPCFLFLLLFVWPVVLQVRSSSFETTKWNDSVRQSPAFGRRRS